MAETAPNAAAADTSVSRGTWADELLASIRRDVCDRCAGEGERLNKLAAGSAIRRERRLLNVSAHALAKRLGVTTSYLCDLELGARAWTPELFLRVAGELDRVRAEQAGASR